MSLFFFDTTVGTAGTALASHAVSGTGAAGGTWTASTSSGSAVLTNANRVRGTAAATTLYYNTAVPGTTDYAVEADLYLATAANYGNVLARASDGRGYYFGFNGNQWQVGRWDSIGVSAALASASSPSIIAAKVYRARLEVSGTGATVTLRCYFDGAIVFGGAVTDTSASRIVTAGAPGVQFYGASTDSSGPHVGNMIASALSDTLTAGTPTLVSSGTSVTGVAQVYGGTYPYTTVKWQTATDSSGSAGTYADISGQTTNDLTTTGTNGSYVWYRTVATDSAGTPATVTSAGVRVLVGTGPVTLTAGNPTLSAITSTGFTATANASAGTAPYTTYQWQEAPDSSGSPGSFSNVGTNSATYTATSHASSTTFWVKYTVTDTATATATSSAVSVTTASNTLTAPTPTSTTPYLNTVTLTEAPTGGTPAYSYQWTRSTDNSTFSNVSGATSSTFSPTETPGSTLWYKCAVTDATPQTVTSPAVKVIYPSKLLILDGDSIPAGYPTVTTGSSSTNGLYPQPADRALLKSSDNNAMGAQLLSILGSDWCVQNMSWSGRPLQDNGTTTYGRDQITDYSTTSAQITTGNTVRAKLLAGVAAGGTVIVANVGEPTNQIGAYANTGGTGLQNAAKASLQTYANAVRTDGGRFVGTTVIARAAAGLSNASFDTDRLAINAWMRANWRSQRWGALADLAADQRFGPQSAAPTSGSNTYYADGAHPSMAAFASASGHGVIAQMLAVAVAEAASSVNPGSGTGINGSAILGMA